MEQHPSANLTVAKKVLATVDKGLVKGLGNREPGEMCVEAAVCYALGLPHGDNPSCVLRELRNFKIALNDLNWSSTTARAIGLRRLALAQLGSETLDTKEFLRLLQIETIKYIVPIALRAAAKIQRDKHNLAFNKAADNCEKHPSIESANAANAAANAVYTAANTAYAAVNAAYAAANAAKAAAYVANTAAYVANAAAYAAKAAAYAANAANAAAYAANAAAYAAKANFYANAYTSPNALYDAANDAANAEKDRIFSLLAERVVQTLIKMKSPGCEFLYLSPLEG